MPQMKLEITHTPPFRRVHYLTLEAYLIRIYRFTKFSVLNAAGVSHGIYPEYRIEAVIPPRLQAKAKRIRAGTHCGSLGLALTVLCADGHIPAGLYVIDTSRKSDPVETYKHLLQQTHDPIHPECVRFKEKHRSDPHFRERVGVIDRSLVEWLKQEPSREP